MIRKVEEVEPGQVVHPPGQDSWVVDLVMTTERADNQKTVHLYGVEDSEYFRALVGSEVEVVEEADGEG